MNIAIVTGSGGLIGSESVEFLSSKFDLVVGIDNDLRAYFFGQTASTLWNTERLTTRVSNFISCPVDIRDSEGIERIFDKYKSDIRLVVHTAAQPSHDWAASDPSTDFTVNANGTLVLLEAVRKHCENAVFIHCSTNKVYGDNPNKLPLDELDTRWELKKDHTFYKDGIDESMSIDNAKHSLFGASKLAGDILAQEYGKYFGMKTGVFRGGCLTGPMHSGTQLHGFLSYLIRCCLRGEPYTIFGYKGKQVRDNIHSWDLVNMFWHFYQNPKSGVVYNVGGSRHSNCSMLEAISMIETYTGSKMTISLSDQNRSGDHIWYISSVQKFKSDFQDWNFTYDNEAIIKEICDETEKRLKNIDSES